MKNESTIGISLEKAIELRQHYPEVEAYIYFCKAPTAWVYDGWAINRARPHTYKCLDDHWQHVNVEIAFHEKQSKIAELIKKEEFFYSPQL